MDADGEGPGRRSCYDDSDSDVGYRPAQHMYRRRQADDVRCHVKKAPREWMINEQ